MAPSILASRRTPVPEPPDGPPDITGPEGFEREWIRAAPDLQRACWRWTRGNQEDTNDILQETAFRAYRARHQFRGGSFKGWVVQIARRLFLDSTRRSNPEDPTDPGKFEGGVEEGERRPSWLGGSQPSVEPAELETPRLDIDRLRLADHAVRTGDISPTNHMVYTRRVKHPEETWEDVARTLGRGQAACEVMCHRTRQNLALPCLRDFPDWVGGRNVIRNAAQTLRERGRLDPKAMLAIEHVILRNNPQYRPNGWKAVSRQAAVAALEQIYVDVNPGAPPTLPL